MQDVAPLLVEPLDREATHAVRLAMIERDAIATVVLSRQRAESEPGSRHRAAPARRHAMLARRVVVRAQPALANRPSLPKKAQFVRRHAVVVQVRRHAGRELVTEREVEREVLDAIPTLRFARRAASRSVKVLDRLTLHDDRIGTLGENRLDGELVRHAQVAQRLHERGVARLTLVPPSAERREARADEDLVDWREVANPGIPARKRAGVLGE